MDYPGNIHHLDVYPMQRCVRCSDVYRPNGIDISSEVEERVHAEVLITKGSISGIPGVSLDTFVTLVQMTVVPVFARLQHPLVAALSEVPTLAAKSGLLVARNRVFVTHALLTTERYRVEEVVGPLTPLTQIPLRVVGAVHTFDTFHCQRQAY